MSTYYEYEDVKVMMVRKLMGLDGWKIYHYHADNSDPMTDYYDPEWWGGIATKNGYILCVDQRTAHEPEEIRAYNTYYHKIVSDPSVKEKISKLERMTVERGASEQEEATAKAAIEKLQRKISNGNADGKDYIVKGIIPGHMANPPRMNWHVEKDGVIVAKGNGILKYSKVSDYYKYPFAINSMREFRENPVEFRKDYESQLRRRGVPEADIERSANYKVDELTEDLKLINQFEAFIRKIDTTCGGLIGEGDGTYYEKVKVTEYKKELKPFEMADGEIKEGQCFILKANFYYGCNKGLVYRIHKTEYKDGEPCFHAYKLNGKLTKECTGSASANNYWYIGTKATSGKFEGWIDKGYIAWCELKEVKVPHEVEKVVKRTIKKGA